MINERLVLRHFVDNRITNEIAGKIHIIYEMQKNEPSIVSLKKGRISQTSLEEEANLHSFKIEHPRFVEGRLNAHVNTRECKNGLKSLKRAFRNGYNNFDFKELDEQYIMELAGRIDPKFHNNLPAQIRRTGARVSGATWIPPQSAKLGREMKDYIDSLKLLSNGRDLRDKLETAIFAHLQLVRIHPFEDINGRTARTIQNIILKKFDLALPIIYVGERDDYYSHLDSAIWDWRKRTAASPDEKYKSTDEKAFYNYIAGKISASYDRILDSK